MGQQCQSVGYIRPVFGLRVCVMRYLEYFWLLADTWKGQEAGVDACFV